MPRSTKTSSSDAATNGTGGAKPETAKTAAGRTATDKSAGAKTTAAKTTAAKSAESKSAEAKSAEARSAAAKSTNVKPAASAKSSGRDPARSGKATTGGAGRTAEDPFVAAQREALHAERNTYLHQAEELQAQADSLALEHEPGDVQFDEEGGEGGTSNVDRELDLILSGQALAAVEEIDRALAKIDAGTYGRCEHCGQPIPEARLEALPHAALCVVCKAGGLSSRR
jgi:DnaK suppressor protein